MFRIVVKKTAAAALLAKRSPTSATARRMASTTVARSSVQPIVWVGGGIAALAAVGYRVVSTSKNKENMVESVDTAPAPLADTTTKKETTALSTHLHQETKAIDNVVKKHSEKQKILLAKENISAKNEEASIPFKHEHKSPRVVGGNYNPHRKHEEDDDDKWFTC